MTATWRQQQADAQRDDDVRGFSADGIAGSLVPPLPTTNPSLPGSGAQVTGWPDATPPVTDPATVAAWLAQKTVRPDR
jgi:hypothetical protein